MKTSAEDNREFRVYMLERALRAVPLDNYRERHAMQQELAALVRSAKAA